MDLYVCVGMRRTLRLLSKINYSIHFIYVADKYAKVLFPLLSIYNLVGLFRVCVHKMR